MLFVEAWGWCRLDFGVLISLAAVPRGGDVIMTDDVEGEEPWPPRIIVPDGVAGRGD